MIKSEDKRYYFDAAAFLKFYRDETGSIKIRRLVASASQQILISSVTILEFVNVILKYHRKGHFKKKTTRKIIQRFRRDVSINSKTRPFTVVESSNTLLITAKIILLQYAYYNNIESMDALHLAVIEDLKSKFMNILFVTSDHGLISVCKKSNIDFCDPETDI
ncbi:MAG: type II toxin-antitoxin system VapC family toxin [Deltaproteobacteria bacterium]|nr:type II toxin-antitoxin system VapC family toxin [Deltaproteobacteria bacterium]